MKYIQNRKETYENLLKCNATDPNHKGQLERLKNDCGKLLPKPEEKKAGQLQDLRNREEAP